MFEVLFFLSNKVSSTVETFTKIVHVIDNMPATECKIVYVYCVSQGVLFKCYLKCYWLLPDL